MKLIFKLFTKFHVFVYRRSGGKILGKMRQMSILLLNSTGRKSGKTRTTPLAYIRDGEAYVIAGSNGGQDHHPAWWWNLKNTPQTTIQVGDAKVAVTAEQAGAEDVERLWPKFVAMEPGYGRYREKTTREIPVVILRPRE